MEKENKIIDNGTDVEKDNEVMKTLIETCEKSGLILDEEQKNQFEIFYRMVIEKNQVMNLTSIVNRDDFFIKHFIDSILPQEYIEKTATVLDLGCGGGFPCVPLKIVRPDIKVTALDSTDKKIEFVKEAMEKLGFENAEAVYARAEEFGQGESREQYDVVVSRAVAELPVLLELAIPLVKIGGMFIAYKTDTKENEISESAAKKLGANTEKVVEKVLPNGDKRSLFIYKKTMKTYPEFPRNFGRIKKKPLA